MLQEGCVSERLLKLLRKLQTEKIFKDYFLVGGTALALQIKHRKSYDIDLFTQKELRIQEIEKYLKQRHSGKYQILNTRNMIYQVMINDIKVDFVHHPFELVEPVYNDSQIKFLGKKDISAMKLHAIENSGNRAKDFIDVYYLLREIPLYKMFDYYKIKYCTENIFNAKRSLGFFDDVPKESWQEILTINQKVTAKIVKKTILSAIQEYNDSYSSTN
ncbi:MAG: nucleotidyl transferase AbiEii/AbiGii toxin family protein [Treponema sp.]|jgi:predicted nucleotidyltransferase component of viral defense system|nr:nucleotidyl transferase AbiEii/AbiGii toxin family protein [Treponema sp.]